jgi:hypothetical protein
MTARSDAPITSSANEGKISMSDDSEFLIPSAILVSAVIAKSELTGKELSEYAVGLHRNFVKIMQVQREADKKS